MAIRTEHLPDLDFSDVVEAGARRVVAPHPGEILLHEFLEPMGITQYRLAKSIGVPQRRIGEIVIGIRGVTVDTGLRLSRFFGMSEGFWTGLQTDFDAAQVKRKLGKVLDKIEPWKPARAA
jgi:addiction module HigA family antidote